MTFSLKFDNVLYRVAGDKPPSRMVLPDRQVLECTWTHGGNGAEAYDMNLVPHNKMDLKPWEVAEAFNAPLAQRIDSQ